MSPRTGRPIIGDEPKNKQITLRVTKTILTKFDACSKITGRTKTDLFEEWITSLHEELTKE